MPKKELNILDDVKDYDRKVRTKLVYKKLDTLKGWAKTILELKEKTELMLRELGIVDEDIKRLIDYVNSQVELTKEDKERLHKEVKSDIEIARKDKDVQSFNPNTGTSTYWVNGTGTTGSYTLGTTDASFLVNTVNDVSFTVK